MINNISSALDAYQQALGRINAGAAKLKVRVPVRRRQGPDLAIWLRRPWKIRLI
ncbi:MAG: hypothetical protein ACLU99_12515 [Alphaproteobacteria bacterium]